MNIYTMLSLDISVPSTKEKQSILNKVSMHRSLPVNFTALPGSVTYIAKLLVLPSVQAKRSILQVANVAPSQSAKQVLGSFPAVKDDYVGEMSLSWYTACSTVLDINTYNRIGIS